MLTASLAILLPAEDAATAPPSDAVSRWSAENNATDTVSGNDGILMGNAGFGQGLVGQAFLFDGVDSSGQHVQIPFDPSLSTSQFSVSLWVKPLSAVDDLQEQEILFAQGNRLRIFIRPGSPFLGEGLGLTVLIKGSLFDVDAKPLIQIPIGEWSHIAITLDGTELTIYINNGIAGTSGTGPNPIISSTCDFSIGGQGFLTGTPTCNDGVDTAPGHFTNALLDEVEYYGRSLTVTEVHEIFQAFVPLRQGDVDCSGSANSIDALKVLRAVASLPVPQREPCPHIGALLHIPDPVRRLWADTDCNAEISSVDALKILRYSAGLDVSQDEPCDDIGAPSSP
jgi:hypothetical protein